MTSHSGLTLVWSMSSQSPCPTPAQSGKLTLKNISFECDMSKRMMAIVGAVGAGKVRLHLL